MDSNSWILPIITFLPLLGAVIIMFMPKEKPTAIKATSIAISIIPLVMSIWLWFAYKSGGPQFPAGRQFMDRCQSRREVARQLHLPEVVFNLPALDGAGPT